MELVEVKNNEIIINNDFIEEYKKFKKLQLEMELKEKEVKLLLKNAMEMTGKKRILKEGFSVTYKAPTTRKSIDTKRFKEELPSVYDEFVKESEVASSVTIKVE